MVTTTTTTPATKPKVSMTSTGSTATATTGTNDVTATGSSTTGSSPIYSYHNYSDTGRSMSRSSSSNKNNPYETPPTIHQYHSDNTSTTTTTASIRSTGGNSIIGDSSLLPNIGRTNQYADFALFGLAYHELMLRLQLSICLTAVLVLVVLFLTWYVQLFQPIHLVFSIVLAVLSLILVMVEGKTLWNQNNTNTNTIFSSSSFHAGTTTTTPSTTTTNPTTIHTVLQQLERMGTIVLYHPMGKTLYLLTCSLLCCSITGMAMFLFALWFLANALTLIYCYVTYPECRTSFASSSSSTFTTENDGSNNNDNNNVGRSWSSYYSDMANTTTVASSWVSERASLLRS